MGDNVCVCIYHNDIYDIYHISQYVDLNLKVLIFSWF